MKRLLPLAAIMAVLCFGCGKPQDSGHARYLTGSGEAWTVTAALSQQNLEDPYSDLTLTFQYDGSPAGLYGDGGKICFSFEGGDGKSRLIWFYQTGVVGDKTKPGDTVEQLDSFTFRVYFHDLARQRYGQAETPAGKISVTGGTPASFALSVAEEKLPPVLPYRLSGGAAGVWAECRLMQGNLTQDAYFLDVVFDFEGPVENWYGPDGTIAFTYTTFDYSQTVTYTREQGGALREDENGGKSLRLEGGSIQVAFPNAPRQRFFNGDARTRRVLVRGNGEAAFYLTGPAVP